MGKAKLDALPLAEVQRLAALSKVPPSAKPPPTKAERQQAAYDQSRQRMKSRSYWQNIVDANGGREPTREELLTLSLPHATALCPICKGQGYLHYDVPLGHLLFGKRVACACKQEDLAVKRRERSQRLADLTSEMSRMTFATYNQSCDPDAYNAAITFVRGVDAQGVTAAPWLYFEGNPGGGKTHLMAAIAHAYLERSDDVMFRVVPKLLDWFRAGFKPQDEDDGDFQWRFDEVCTVPLLLLDDLGAEYGTPWTREKLFTLVNHRYARRLKTVFSTNVMVSDLDDRIRSRVQDRAVCEHIYTTEMDYRTRDDRVKQRRGSRR